MSAETYDKSNNFSKTSRPNSDDEDVENDHEEDNTARLDLRIGVKNTSENVDAPQRVKSLAQRNRMVSLLYFLLGLCLLRAIIDFTCFWYIPGDRFGISTPNCIILCYLLLQPSLAFDL